MDKIILEDVNDVLKREKLFKKSALKLLSTLKYTKPDTGFTLLRTQKELDDLEKEYVDVDNTKKIQKIEKTIKKKVEEVSEEIEYEPELSRKERVSKNKKKYPVYLTKGKKKREMKSRKKSRRRRNK
ncbi:uncharacterized protein VNE69_10011 [Vairimorpha necatrix]|uniref:Uncharacterized protein n=1 Tax=Vairimorpha necatrix TaxID=6039 RepID=A0AAX4JFD2_9MICR